MPLASPLRSGALSHVRRYIGMSRRLNGKARKIAIVSRKGGAGKSTITREVVSGLALRGFRVAGFEVDDNMRLMSMTIGRGRRGAMPLDDSQTTYALFSDDAALGIARKLWEVDTRDLLGKVPSLSKDRVAELVSQRGWQNAQPFYFLPGSEQLSTIDETYAVMAADARAVSFNPNTRLADAISYYDDEFDLMVFDTPPSLQRLQQNVVTAATDGLICVLDFDPDSVSDYDRTIAFYRRVRNVCQNQGRQVPKILGLVFNKFNPNPRWGVPGGMEALARLDAMTGQINGDMVDDNDILLLHAYTRQHVNPDTRQMDGPLVDASYRVLGVLPMDDERCKRAMAQGFPLHTSSPTSALGMASHELVVNIERALGIENTLGSAVAVSATRITAWNS